ncbi:exocyst complex component Sec6-domain-containing protein [Phakopsora pachyrhizi]|uniref:Exocyst complex component Sec6-domain-containing protein n=1 Tax=Phakopsora pachyrhizi TaxID=170000 RepID=A0AAV0B4G5_PHAPC|nr:exocyst complex component Sec6-domain-containing protein [Phakopsora pachyrhizi]
MDRDITAARAVSELLKSPDDLNKLSQIRKRLQKEQLSIDSKLRIGSKAQLDSTREALSALRESKNQIGIIKEDMIAIEKACEDPKVWVEGFGKIASVSRIHRNFEATAKMVEQLRDMDYKVQRIEKLLAKDRSSPLGEAPNLLAIHYCLSELETFRNETMLQANRDGDSSTIKTLTGYFEPLAGTIEAFESHYLHLSSTLLDIVKKGNARVAIKIAKIAEIEGSRDEKAIAIKLVKRQNKDIAARFQSVHAEARVMKHYRSKVMESIRSSAKTLIEAQFLKFNENPAAFFEGENFDWYYQDLLLVEEKLVEMFPEDWKIYHAYIKAYHKALYEFIKNYSTSGEAEAGALLSLVKFIKEYKDNMTKELDIPAELLEPPLLDDNTQTLVDEYLKLITKKMEEWTQNLMRGETKLFIQRAEPPEEDADQMYTMQGSSIMFQMVNAQVDFAIDSGQGGVLARVVEESAKVMIKTQNEWLDLLKEEFKKQMSKSDIQGGLVEYTISLANDQLNKLEGLVSEKYREMINEKLSLAMDGYLEVAKRCVQVLIEAVFNDVKPAVKMLFGSGWYSNGGNDPMVLIVETIKDYLVDYQAHLSPNLFELLVDDIIDSFLIAYLNGLKKASKIKIPDAIDQMRSDVKLSYTFFVGYKKPVELKAHFKVLEHVVSMLSASRTMFFLDWHSFAKEYGPQVVNFTEKLLKAREDFDKTAVNEIMESVKKKKDELVEPEIPTIFSRLEK